MHATPGGVPDEDDDADRNAESGPGSSDVTRAPDVESPAPALPEDERLDDASADDVLRTFTHLMFVAAVICAIPRQIWSAAALVTLGVLGRVWQRVRRTRARAPVKPPAG